MACSSKSVFHVPKLNENMLLGPKSKEFCSLCPSKHGKAKPSINPVLSNVSINAQATICVSKNLRWWKKNLKSNMIEIHSAEELVHSLVNAGDALVVLDFYSPGCGACKALHPKICQIAELYPSIIFLKVNYEELSSMCRSLHIHVLPFFRFYRGADGRVCSFSCTNTTIKKFKDAIAKHGNQRCSLGEAKGLDESELKDLASIGEIRIDSPSLYSMEEKMKDFSDVWNMTTSKDYHSGFVTDILW
ncbi:thioredoxin-like 1-2, chloroplastic [Vicia villosa]|uniref:thioredoxin-like 1-2, chloroplastic n=1 Tax=Vicia villosa TaxID=3911 RepID=UPI00273B8018|nr:thioredoxin-like 1-2, chloroplastic [Vicia villosa]